MHARTHTTHATHTCTHHGSPTNALTGEGLDAAMDWLTGEFFELYNLHEHRDAQRHEHAQFVTNSGITISLKPNSYIE